MVSQSDTVTAMASNNGITDIELNSIAEEIGHDINKLGLRLGFTWTRTQFYQLRNRMTWSCSGTMEMLHSWRKLHSYPEQRRVLAKSLRRSDLIELAERVSEGEFIPPAREGILFVPVRIIHFKCVLSFTSLAIALLAIAWTIFCINLLVLPAEIKELRGHLVHYYDSSFCDIKTVPWNSSSTLDLESLFINLKLLHRDVHEGGELTRTSISHSSLFELQGRNGKLAKRILLRGAAGTGKTTLTCKIAHDWGRCLWGFSIRCIPLVIILQLRLIDPKNTLGQEVLNQGLVPRDRHNTITADLIDSFISQNPHSAIVIFDGYDEFVSGGLKDDEDEGIFDIIRYTSFRDTTVLITCRPWRISDFESVPDYTHVELTGFSAENVVAYVKKFFRHNQTKTDELLNWLSAGKFNGSASSLIQDTESMPCDTYYFDCDIQDVSYTARYPLFLTMFCELFKNEVLLKQVRTVPEVFNNIIEFMYEQYLDKLNDRDKDGLMPFDHLKVFLGRPAYEGLWGQPQGSANEKTVFDAAEFKKDIVFRLGSEIGFLTNIPEHDYYRDRMPRRKVYTTEFFHRFIQEYFASCYLNYLQENFPDEASEKLQAIRVRATFAKSGIVVFFCAPSTRISTEKQKQYAEAQLKNVDVLYINEYVHTPDSGDMPEGFSRVIRITGGGTAYFKDNIIITSRNSDENDEKE